MATVEKAPETDTTRSVNELFKFSAWVHLSAEECDHAEDGTCTDPQHFHAWCRLPNQFQHQDIRERALAARARRIRQLRDADSDSHLVLEADLDSVRGDRDELVEEVVSKEWWKRHLEAMGDVEERDEYKHMDRDRERLRELQGMPEERRPAEELAELERHLDDYATAVDERRKELEKPVRDAAEGMEDDELIDAVREQRIDAEAGAAFMDVYSRWEWFAGTYTTADPATRQRRFASVQDLEEAAPEIIEALRVTFADLEASLQRGQRGN